MSKARKLADKGGDYGLRGAFVADAATQTWKRGTVVSAEGFQYVYDTAATEVIDDLPGFLPFGIVSPQHFGAAADGTADDSAAVAAALAYIMGMEKGHLHFPTGVYRLASRVTFDNSGGSGAGNYTISGNGSSSIIAVDNADGGIEINNVSRHVYMDVYKLVFSPRLANSGTAFEYTATEGGNAQRNVFVMQDCVFEPHIWTDLTSSFYNPVVVTGVNRPLFNRIIIWREPTEGETKPNAILNLDGCYNPVVRDSYINGAATYGISNIVSDTNEGFVLNNVIINQADTGVYVAQPNRHPLIWITDCHMNSYVAGVHLDNCKYAWLQNNLMYTRNGAGESFIDFRLVDCDNVHIQNTTYRTINAGVPNRRHVSCENSRVVRISDFGFAGSTAIAPYYFDATSKDCELHVPNSTTDYDSSDYPDTLYEIASGAERIRVIAGGELEYPVSRALPDTLRHDLTRGVSAIPAVFDYSPTEDTAGRFIFSDITRTSGAGTAQFADIRMTFEDGANVSPAIQFKHNIEAGTNRGTPWMIVAEQNVAGSVTDWGSDPSAVMVFMRSVAQPGLDEVNQFGVDMQVTNSLPPSNNNTEPGTNIVTRAGGMQVLEINAHRSSAWGDDDDIQKDQAEVIQTGGRGGGETFAFVKFSFRPRANPWSGIAVGGDGSAGDPVILPDEATLSSTDDGWFTDEPHWLILDKEDGYADPVTPYEITGYSAATRAVTLATALPEDIAGKRVSIIGVMGAGVHRNAIRIEENNMNALAGVTLRNRSGEQLSEIVSENIYHGPVFDYSQATFDGDIFASVPQRAGFKYEAAARFNFDLISERTAATAAAVNFFGNNSTGVQTEYASIRGLIANETAGSERGALNYFAPNAGVETAIARMIPPGTDGDTSMWLATRKSGVITLQPVSYGADDSGGTGFAVLRVPNPT